MRALRHALAAAILAAGLLTAGKLAAQTGVIAGRVLTADGEPAPDAEITLVEARRRTRVGADGGFRFAGLAPGEYHLQVDSPRYGRAAAHVELAPGQVVEENVFLDLLFHAEAITVTLGPGGRELDEVAQPVQVLSDRELLAQREATLGETLSEEAGVSSTWFGPGASRPVIRGLGGDRIRVLEGGIGTGDASSTSPDHAVSQDPLSTERIEIVRGPSTLLYGSSAIGGVVNIIDERIPRFATDIAVTGAVEGRAGTVSDERAGGFSVGGGVGPIAWHVGGLRRDAGDVEIPLPADVLENTSLESTNGTAGVSVVGDAGFLGAAWSGFDTNYGVPGHAEEEEGGAVRIDLEQRRFDVEGEWNRVVGFLRGARARLGTTNYEHAELEGGEVGTTFTNDAWEGRIEALHLPLGPLTGAFGVQAQGRDFTATGEEAFVPPTETRAWALFAFEEAPLTETTRIQIGARFERQEVDAAPFRDEPARSRAFHALSASAGVVWNPAEAYGVTLSVARSKKLPNAEELFSDGPHVATRSFEVGDPDLGPETSLGLDLGLRFHSGRVTGDVSGFANRFQDFIYEAFTGAEEDGLPVVRFTQEDALFVGAEARLDVELFHAEPHHVALELQGDVVRAELSDPGEPLPRIPPMRLGAGLHYRGKPLWGEIGALRVFEQDRVAPFETPTEGYTMVSATVGWRFFAGSTIHDVVLRASNLADQEARNHVSFLKDVAPLPGRDVSLAYRVSF